MNQARQPPFFYNSSDCPGHDLLPAFLLMHCSSNADSDLCLCLNGPKWHC